MTHPDEFTQDEKRQVLKNDQRVREQGSTSRPRHRRAYAAVRNHLEHGTDIFFNLRGRPDDEVAQERRRKRQS